MIEPTVCKPLNFFVNLLSLFDYTYYNRETAINIGRTFRFISGAIDNAINLRWAGSYTMRQKTQSSVLAVNKKSHFYYTQGSTPMTCNEWQGPSPGLSTEQHKNVAAMASR